jgi:hypothetical protein
MRGGRTQMKLGRAQTGQLFPALAWGKVEKALISPCMCWLWSGRHRSPVRGATVPDDAIRGVVTLLFCWEKSGLF